MEQYQSGVGSSQARLPSPPREMAELAGESEDQIREFINNEVVFLLLSLHVAASLSKPVFLPASSKISIHFFLLLI